MTPRYRPHPSYDPPLAAALPAAALVLAMLGAWVAIVVELWP